MKTLKDASFMRFCSVFEHQIKKYLFRTMRTWCEPVTEGSPKGAAITERDYALSSCLHVKEIMSPGRVR